MFCAKCGAEIQAGNSFCTLCGKPVAPPTANYDLSSATQASYGNQPNQQGFGASVPSSFGGASVPSNYGKSSATEILSDKIKHEAERGKRRNQRRAIVISGGLLLLLVFFGVPLLALAYFYGGSLFGGGSGKPDLRIHGSNTIGGKLAPELAKAFLENQGAKVQTRKKKLSSAQSAAPNELSKLWLMIPAKV